LKISWYQFKMTCKSLIPIENETFVCFDTNWNIYIEILIPNESNNQLKVKNQIILGKHNSYQYRYQFKMKHDINIENFSIYHNNVFFIIKNESKIPIENKIDWKILIER